MNLLLKTYFFIINRIERKLKERYIKQFKKCTESVCFNPLSSIFEGRSNISIGDETYIGPRALFYSTNAQLTIGKKVVFGPSVTIITGDHRTDVIGKYIKDVTQKLPENDKDVIIEDDVWVGTNVTILKGVTIGHGSIVAAGAVITKSFPAYSIIGGCPAKLLKMRFNENEIIEHEKLIKENQL